MSVNENAPGADGESTSTGALQRAYHSRLFNALSDWDLARDQIRDLTGDTSADGLMGLDQMGHFGPNGCALIVDSILSLRGDGIPTLMCELGGGFGGALRYIIERLADRDLSIERGLSVDVVTTHAIAAQRIDTAVRCQGIHHIAGDAHKIPIQSNTVDIVTVTGSFSHFGHPEIVLKEIGRILAPRGIVAITEEVSLVGQRRPISREFRRLHPNSIFSLSSWDQRERHLEESGLTEIRMFDLTDWAIDLLDARLRALNLLKGTAEAVYGRPEVELIQATLRAALDEYSAKTLRPALITACGAE